MADNQGKPVKGDERSNNLSAEELRRRARHQQEDEPTRRNATDEDVGKDRIDKKGIGGFGAQEGTTPRSAPPLSDNSGRKQ
jgi:hypothetical protein